MTARMTSSSMVSVMGPGPWVSVTSSSDGANSVRGHAGTEPATGPSDRTPILRDVWFPRSAGELESAIRDAGMEETSQLEFKEALPSSKANVDIAVDVSAMTVDGGVVVYGVGEDEHGRPSRLCPIELAGSRERIDQVLRSSVQESPTVRLTALPLESEPGRGYLVVVVPPSPRAPHQVVASGRCQFRYYGRGPTGKRILSEAEIARLYARRTEWSFDRRAHLQTVVGLAPYDRMPGLGFLHAFLRPVVVDDDRWTSAAGNDPAALQQRMIEAARRANRGLGYDPALADAASWSRHGADAWRLSRPAPSGSPEYCVRCDVNFDGRGQLFSGRAAARLEPKEYEPDQPGQLVIFEQAVAGNLASFFALMAELYSAAAYSGPVDIGVALTRIGGAQALSVARNLIHSGSAYPEPDYLTDVRVNAADLEAPRELARRVMSRFFEALIRPGYDPFS